MIVVDDDSPPSAAPDRKEQRSAKRPSQKREEEEEEWILRGGSRCPICFLALSKNVAALMGCGHTFHLLCIEEWFKQRGGRSQKPTCPYCAKEYASRRYILSLHFDLPDLAARVSSLSSSSNAADENPETRLRRLELELREERREKEAAREEAMAHAAALEAHEAREEELVRQLRAEEEQRAKLASRVQTLEEARLREEETRQNACRTYEENRRVLEEKYHKLTKKCQSLQFLATVVKEDRLEGATLLDKIRRLPGLTSDEKLARIMPLVEFLKRSKAVRTAELKKLKKENFLLRRKLSASALAELPRDGAPSERRREEASSSFTINRQEKDGEARDKCDAYPLPSSSSSSSSSSPSPSASASSSSSSSSSSSLSVGSSSLGPAQRSERQSEERRENAHVSGASSRPQLRLSRAPALLSRRLPGGRADSRTFAAASLEANGGQRPSLKDPAKPQGTDGNAGAADARKEDSEAEGENKRMGEKAGIAKKGGKREKETGICEAEGGARRRGSEAPSAARQDEAREYREKSRGRENETWVVGRRHWGTEEAETSWRKRRREEVDDAGETGCLSVKRRVFGDRRQFLPENESRAGARPAQASRPASLLIHQVEDEAEAEKPEEEGWRGRRQRRQQLMELEVQVVPRDADEEELEGEEEETQLDSELASLFETPESLEKGRVRVFCSSFDAHPVVSGSPSASNVVDRDRHVSPVSSASSSGPLGPSSSSSCSFASSAPSPSAPSPLPFGSNFTSVSSVSCSAPSAPLQTTSFPCASLPLPRNTQTSTHAASERDPPRGNEEIGSLSSCDRRLTPATSKQTNNSVPSFIAHFLLSPSSVEKLRSRERELRDTEHESSAFFDRCLDGSLPTSAVQTPQRPRSRDNSRGAGWEGGNAENSSGVRIPGESGQERRTGAESGVEKTAASTRESRLEEAVSSGRHDGTERSKRVDPEELDVDGDSCESDRETVRESSDASDCSSNENLKNELTPSTSLRRDERRKWGSLQPYRPESLTAGVPCKGALGGRSRRRHLAKVNSPGCGGRSLREQVVCDKKSHDPRGVCTACLAKPPFGRSRLLNATRSTGVFGSFMRGKFQVQGVTFAGKNSVEKRLLN
ncbi:zinc finger, C3HC4 type (RING finger) domain-containing protein [Toxoplasma gondii ME49]|uniref:Zinc finger (C3HC4 RING finger) protein,putative n=8 Tax=Toxoplasma gondii TaxID=5811 RepID=A0A125YH15_TOXGV|nr:zinc finger, C3HC4 type (RING finger) domain-containing protein [Toxoplasma gondii ME49]EPT24936.1 zinc finger, C3HC4 type (RING finger) domain-containing protein [Toxoplasma gondii ME49]ESS34358.1 zinc finger, C3HC4 type (RING finger) domain-containing protein [Toxoplasma gondii VEG]CEL78400.1 TPA: zinc finger (C3HC4 RING finger) protein,putative [Toxoplasma gondii VEG]|eukprot:XP_018634964.1 zinc finger, C3HC4 type (RING finger) domain-containing protein [Toxoplasma gondii ME49]